MVTNNTSETFLIGRTLYHPGDEIPDDLAKEQGIYAQLSQGEETSESVVVSPVTEGGTQGSPLVVTEGQTAIEKEEETKNTETAQTTAEETTTTTSRKKKGTS
ncbi:MAG: hypothetical protein KME46_25925 [Brasilonema angustatum HA4187-MV1]|jgi:hypothetical protein|nr:hypothetical protein [Brasilonema angustatum HA4187-MV1]